MNRNINGDKQWKYQWKEMDTINQWEYEESRSLSEPATIAIINTKSATAFSAKRQHLKCPPLQARGGQEKEMVNYIMVMQFPGNEKEKWLMVKVCIYNKQIPWGGIGARTAQYSDRKFTCLYIYIHTTL